LFIVAMLALSASGAISPVLAALLHASSTVAVLFNAARLLREGEEIL
jgi:Cd2+/Zn2+-exporting ATPase